MSSSSVRRQRAAWAVIAVILPVSCLNLSLILHSLGAGLVHVAVIVLACVSCFFVGILFTGILEERFYSRQSHRTD
jgi:hypothetical protein